MRPVSCGNSLLKHLPIANLFHLSPIKLGHGEHIHINLFNLCQSRRVLLGVPLITVGSCQYTPFISLRRVIGQALIVLVESSRNHGEVLSICDHRKEGRVCSIYAHNLNKGRKEVGKMWMRGPDLNQRFPTYEDGEMTNFSTPRY